MANVSVIGAGHNGLVCACYLARAGHKVTVFEMNSLVGGACREEIWPSGAVISPGANHFGMFSPVVAQELGIDLGKLEIQVADPALLVGVAPGESIALYNDSDKTEGEIARFNKNDCHGYKAFVEDIEIVRRVIRLIAHDSKATRQDFENALRSVKADLVPRFLSGSIRETVEAYFEHEVVRAAFAATTVLYNAGPSAEGTSFAFAYLSLSEVDGVPGWGVPRGGMGKLPALLASVATSLGVTIVTSRKVKKIEIARGSVRGLVLDDNTKINSDIVVSNADPYNTFITLAGLDDNCFSGMQEDTFYGPCGKFNFTFRGGFKPLALHKNHEVDLPKSVYVYLPSVDFYEQAFRSAQVSEYSEHPYFEFISPTTFDSNLAPQGINIGSMYLLFANYRILAEHSQNRRDELKEMQFEQIRKFLQIEDVLEKELLDPLDIEEKFGFHLGNVDHGPQVLNNLFERRGVHSFPTINGLAICGSGTHPGGLVSGIPGRNTALRILG